MTGVFIATDISGFNNELYEMVRVFLPNARPAQTDAAVQVGHVRSFELGGLAHTVRLYINGEWTEETVRSTYDADSLAQTRHSKRAAKMALYRLLRAATGLKPPWGGLTGVRPTRLLAERYALGENRQTALASLASQFDVCPDKLTLLADCHDMQRGFIEHAPDEIDIYVGIPFCATRCAYCSFPSEPIGKSAGCVNDYLAALNHEITACAQMLREQGYRPRAVYVGGGTPTSLNVKQIEGLLSTLRNLFPEAAEWTVEAGRPDSVDDDKLKALREYGIGRISINPQTMNDETLARIGRAHTAKQCVEAFGMARRHGFEVINMDLIVALPGEGLSDVAETLNQALSLQPENLTVHTLAIKRAARYGDDTPQSVPDDVAAAMIDLAARAARAAELFPYYLYRQKQMAGGLENVGYARPGTQCMYNIDQMEETTSIAAFGAGAATKWLFPAQRRIERTVNTRTVTDYITRIDEMISRKAALINR